MSTYSHPVTADITDVVPESRLIPVEQVKPGMSVFDTFGGTHPVESVKVERYGVTIRRTDKVRSWHPRLTVITVIGDALEDAGPLEVAECDHLWMTEYAVVYCFSCGAKR